MIANTTSQLRLLLAALFVVLVSLSGCGGQDPASEAASKAAAVASQWQAVDGRSGSLADLSGRWLLVNWWAVWCAPCREEIPEFNHLDLATDDAGLMVLGVNFDQPASAALADAVATLDVRFPVLRSGLAGALGLAPPEVLPSTMLLAPDGRLVATLIGPQTAADLQAALTAAGVPAAALSE